MPLMDLDTEFAIKWQHVYDIQTREGLNDPVKVFEYLNWFYVIEGNKRVSVLKYLNNYSYQGMSPGWSRSMTKPTRTYACTTNSWIFIKRRV